MENILFQLRRGDARRLDLVASAKIDGQIVSVKVAVNGMVADMMQKHIDDAAGQLAAYVDRIDE